MSDDEETKRQMDPSVGGGVDRDKLDASDFVFSDTRTFPVVKPGDVSDAVSSWGRYKGPHTFDEFKRRLMALCKRKGPEFEAQLPAAWKEKSWDGNGAVKIVDENARFFTIGGYGVVWGGRDLAGEYFTKSTDFWFDRLTENPMLLYQHGYDKALKREVLSKVTTKRPDDYGLWIESQIQLSHQYAEAVHDLVARGVIGLSAGAVSHLAEIASSGEIKSWPIAEFSLTPTPCEPRTLGVSELQSLADVMPEVKAFLAKVDEKSAPDATAEMAAVNDTNNAETAVQAARKDIEMNEEQIKALIEATTKSVMEQLKAEPEIKKAEFITGVEPSGEGEKFKSLGEFLGSVWNESHGLGQDNRLVKGMSTAPGSAGGFVMPEEFSNQILMAPIEDEAFAPRCFDYPMSAEQVHIPYWADASHASSLFGGVIVYRRAPGGAVTDAPPSLGQVTLTAKNVTAYTFLANELVRGNNVGLENLLVRMFGKAIAYTKDDDFIWGTGAGMPLGVMNAPALITVAKESGQAAATVVTENITKMWARMLPACRRTAVWLANLDIQPQLLTMGLSVGVGGGPTYLPLGGLSGAPFDTLMGRPVVYTEKAQTLGTPGDLILADGQMYLNGHYGDLIISSSEHVRFLTSETCWKVELMYDGQPWLPSAITPKRGNSSLSAFVALAVRA